MVHRAGRDQQLDPVHPDIHPPPDCNDGFLLHHHLSDKEVEPPRGDIPRDPEAARETEEAERLHAADHPNSVYTVLDPHPDAALPVHLPKGAGHLRRGDLDHAVRDDRESELRDKPADIRHLHQELPGWPSRDLQSQLDCTLWRTWMKVDWEDPRVIQNVAPKMFF